MQLGLKNSWFYTLCQMATRLIWKPAQLTRLVLSRSDLYRTLNLLPMTQFLNCLVDEDYSALIISGTAPAEELKEVWLNLLSEYYEIKGESGGEEWLLRRDIIRYQNHLFLLQECINFLQERYSTSVANSLRRLGYTFKPQDTEPEKYLHLLVDIQNKSKTKYIRLKQMIKQLQTMTDALTAKAKKPTREYFDQMLIEIEQMQRGAVYNFDDLNVAKFLALEKKYWKTVEMYEQLKHK